MKAESKDVSFQTPLLEASVIDSSKGIFELTLIREGLTEDKKRDYSARAIEQAASLFEGAQAFADHPTKSEMKDRPERSIRDLIGHYESVRVIRDGQGSKLRANLKTLESAKWVRPLLEEAATNPKLCGASIHANGMSLPRGGQGGADLVESIDEVFSTDIVTKPNAGGRVERLIASRREEETKGGNDVDMKEITIEQLIKERPDLVESFQASFAKQAEDKNKVSLDKSEVEVLKEAKKKVEELTVASKITESKILDAVKKKEDKEKVKKDLTEAMAGKTPEEMDTIIESRKAFIASLGVEIVGNPAKEDQAEQGKAYHIGTLLPEAKRAWANLNLREVV